MLSLRSTVFVVAGLISSVTAKTDLAGCTSFDTVVKPSNGDYAYATRIYYVPDTGEVCDFLDCGGGRAPPKTTVPGCPLYKGTATYSPSFINPKTLGQVAQSTSAGASSAMSAMTTASLAGTSTEVGGTTSLQTSKATTSAPVSSGGPQANSESSSAAGSSKATSSTASAVGALHTANPVVGKLVAAALAAGVGLL